MSLFSTMRTSLVLICLASAGFAQDIEDVYICSLCEDEESGTDCLGDLSRFLLIQMTAPGEMTAFGFQTNAGMTVGMGELQTNGVGSQKDESRWVIGDWRPRDDRGPFLSLVSFHPDLSIHVSVVTSETSHQTFAGNCKLVDAQQDQ